ncbi:MAG: sulfotransferase family protein, partial [Planctomycetales bacterium]|nr:sulfotransferase family protein [Planctomycetales bacterium]
VKMVYRLLYDLPQDRNYRVLFMRRKLDEVLASQKIMLERKGVATSEEEQEQIARLLTLEIEKIISWLAAQPNFDVLYVDYNELMDSPERLLG